jgi:cobalt/nickel transport system permease protein
MAMGAVFSFIIMMFNVPIPDGTTAHATGAVLIALALGPWAALISVSIALFIQAVIFGDGGVLAFAANAFNIAFVAPFVGYYTYRLVAQNASFGSTRQFVAAFAAGFIGLNAAALTTALMFGIQPIFFTAADGTPLYCPYGLAIAIPAMLLPHLIIAGPLEGIVTAVAYRYMLKSSPDIAKTGAAAKGGCGNA